MNERWVAIWIDHKQAHIVEADDGFKPVRQTIESLVEPRHRTTGQAGVPLPGHLGGNTEDHDRNRRALQLERYFDRVIEAIPSGATVLLLGPGVAKREFLKRAGRHPELASRIVRIATAGKLSVNQIVAELRKLASMEESGTQLRV